MIQAILFDFDQTLAVSVEGVVAVNRVFHDAMRASHVLMPVIS